MAPYMPGNLAVQPQPDRQVEPRREQTASGKRVRTISAGEKLLYLFSIVIFAAVAGFIIMRYVEIYQLNARIHSIEAEIKRAEIEFQSLKHKIAILDEPERMRAIGEQLGLKPRSEEQTVRMPAILVPADSASSASGGNEGESHE